MGADTDPFNQVREWWNRPPKVYAAPSEHLFETLGLARNIASGQYACGKGLVLVERIHPAAISRSRKNTQRLMQCLRTAVESTGEKHLERNSIQLGRGPYVLAACLSESVNSEPLQIQGQFIDLLDSKLSIITDPKVMPGQQTWLLDLKEVKGELPLALAAAGRIETWKTAGTSLSYTITSPQDIRVVTRILLPAPPQKVIINGDPVEALWHGPSQTVLIEHDGHPTPVRIVVKW